MILVHQFKCYIIVLLQIFEEDFAEIMALLVLAKIKLPTTGQLSLPLRNREILFLANQQKDSIIFYSLTKYNFIVNTFGWRASKRDVRDCLSRFQNGNFEHYLSGLPANC